MAVSGVNGNQTQVNTNANQGKDTKSLAKYADIMRNADARKVAANAGSGNTSFSISIGSFSRRNSKA